jgi:hypothetical protein
MSIATGPKRQRLERLRASLGEVPKRVHGSADVGELPPVTMPDDALAPTPDRGSEDFPFIRIHLCGRRPR